MLSSEITTTSFNFFYCNESVNIKDAATVTKKKRNNKSYLIPIP